MNEASLNTAGENIEAANSTERLMRSINIVRDQELQRCGSFRENVKSVCTDDVSLEKIVGVFLCEETGNDYLSVNLDTAIDPGKHSELKQAGLNPSFEATFKADENWDLSLRFDFISYYSQVKSVDDYFSEKKALLDNHGLRVEIDEKGENFASVSYYDQKDGALILKTNMSKTTEPDVWQVSGGGLIDENDLRSFHSAALVCSDYARGAIEPESLIKEIKDGLVEHEYLNAVSLAMEFLKNEAIMSTLNKDTMAALHTVHEQIEREEDQKEAVRIIMNSASRLPWEIAYFLLYTKDTSFIDKARKIYSQEAESLVFSRAGEQLDSADSAGEFSLIYQGDPLPRIHGTIINPSLGERFIRQGRIYYHYNDSVALLCRFYSCDVGDPDTRYADRSAEHKRLDDDPPEMKRLGLSFVDAKVLWSFLEALIPDRAKGGKRPGHYIEGRRRVPIHIDLSEIHRILVPKSAKHKFPIRFPRLQISYY